MVDPVLMLQGCVLFTLTGDVIIALSIRDELSSVFLVENLHTAYVY